MTVKRQIIIGELIHDQPGYISTPSLSSEFNFVYKSAMRLLFSLPGLLSLVFVFLCGSDPLTVFVTPFVTRTLLVIYKVRFRAALNMAAKDSTTQHSPALLKPQSLDCYVFSPVSDSPAHY